MLSKYNEIIPNGAERIMAMAEKQQVHRQGLESHVVRSNTSNQRLGVVLGFILAMSVAAGGFWLIHEGKSGSGIAAVIASIGTPAGIFIWGRVKQEQERREKLNGQEQK